MWCMSYPNVLVQSVLYPAATHARASSDSHPSSWSARLFTPVYSHLHSHLFLHASSSRLRRLRRREHADVGARAVAGHVTRAPSRSLHPFSLLTIPLLHGVPQRCIVECRDRPFKDTFYTNGTEVTMNPQAGWEDYCRGEHDPRPACGGGAVCECPGGRGEQV